VTVERQPGDLRAALAKTIVGQEGVLEALLLALLSNGHVLLEGRRVWQKRSLAAR